MRSLCITGACPQDLDLVCRILSSAGMQASLASDRHTHLDIVRWHEQVCDQATTDPEDTRGAIDPGRLWEQLAADIYLANLNAEVWGWADERSTWLLEFWRKFEPRLRFVLVYTSPQRLIASALLTPLAMQPLEEQIENWRRHNEHLLRFHQRLPKRCLLVDIEDCIANPDALVAGCANRWRMPLNAPQLEAPAPDETHPLAMHLAGQIASQYTNAQALHDEISPLLHCFSPDLFAERARETDFEGIIASFRTLATRVGSVDEIQALQSQIGHLTQQYEEALTTRRTEQEQTSARIQSLEQQLKSTEQVGRKSAKDIEEARKENELLLLQLHQVQEELESLFQKSHEQTTANQQLVKQKEDLEKDKVKLTKERDEVRAQGAALTQAKAALEKERADLIARRDELQKQLASATATRDEQAKLATERQKQIATLTSDRDGKAKQIAEQKATSEKLTAEGEAKSKALQEQQKALQTLSAERDGKSNELAQVQKSAAALSLAKAVLEKDKAELTQKVAEATEQAARHGRSLQAVENKSKEMESENELLLLQLHQVQEELEHYFEMHRDVQKNLQGFEERWRRMMHRNPDYADYAGIEILAFDPARSLVTWRFKDLLAAGRNFPELQFRTFVDQGYTGFVFDREDGSSGPLQRWPIAAAEKNAVVLIPVGKGKQLQDRLSTLVDLAPSDWVLVRVLTCTLSALIKNRDEVVLPENFPSQLIVSGLEALASVMESFPNTLRFDRIELKREQVNPDYEHLWFRLENPSFGKEHWPELEFRFSCAHVTPGAFGLFPKLEFPEEGGQAPFDTWFNEAYDDFGAKLELRFSAPGGMDTAVWQRISAHDQAFISGLIGRLPSMLAALQVGGADLERSWADWVAMARETRTIFLEHTRVQPGRQVEYTASTETETVDHPAPAQLWSNAVVEPMVESPTASSASTDTKDPTSKVVPIGRRNQKAVSSAKTSDSKGRSGTRKRSPSKALIGKQRNGDTRKK